MGRKRKLPEHTPTDETRAKVAALAARDVTLVNIARMMGLADGVSDSTAIKNVREYYRNELEIGFATGEASTVNELDKLIKAGHFPAIRFKLICKHGWNEKTTVDLSSSDGSMSPPKISPGDAVLAILKAEQDKAEKALTSSPPDPPKLTNEG